MEQTRQKRSLRKKLLLAVGTVLFAAVGGFLVWASFYYPAEDTALAVMRTGSGISAEDDLVVLEPSYPTDTGFIFYPGAKVEAEAYLPILEKIRQECGVTCILVKMPLRMAIFNSDAAADAMARFPEISRWYVGGHSMGGAMASSFASKHEKDVAGLVLMGAYLYGDFPPAKTLTVYGTFNSDLEKKIDYTENIVVIEGGNHAQFGNYGRQKGDPDATITAEQQQEITVKAVAEFLRAGKEGATP